MEHLFSVACLWLGLAVLAAVVAYHLRLSIALVEICLGVLAGNAVSWLGVPALLHADEEWLRFLGTSGAVLLTFLAGAELDPGIIRTKLKEVSAVGCAGFLAPFLGCTAVAYGLGWGMRASLLTGVALSATSMAVIYTVMLETGLNRTGFGKSLLGASFVNDLSTVVALGLLFAPFTYRTPVFLAVCGATLALLPRITALITKTYANRTAAIRTKWIMLVLFGLGTLAFWSGSEAVLPAYVAGIVSARGAARDTFWIRRLRTLTIGFLTPFYFLRVGTFVSLPALWAAPLVFMLLLGAKVAVKIFGLYPLIGRFRKDRNERWFFTLLMSTGLTFGTIAAIFGLAQGIVTQAQYSYLVAAVIASAVVPTVIAGKWFLPKRLLSAPEAQKKPRTDDGLEEEG
ncbi:MAG: cation:proton antiporter [Deltaproteobacteria bacterium]|nr:cation:proton antiporter [Deltaproteobacteria bacterium]